MFGWRRTAVLGLLLMFGFAGFARMLAQSSSEEETIRNTLNVQVTAWNKGDIPEFMSTYENSPLTTTVGVASVTKGFGSIADHYKKAYANKAQMGTLTFSELDVRLLPASSGAVEYAVVTGKFHLDRSIRGEAKKDNGIFSLVWHKSGGQWKILLDHTS